MKKILALTILLACILSLSACSAKSEKSVLDKDTIVVGMELKYPPFETKDEAGNPDGASVMLANALGKYLDKEVKIVDTAYSSLIPALQAGTIDIIISSMTITEEREKVVDFSDPYTTSQLMMLVYKDSPVQSIDDLNKDTVTIASKSGTIGALWAAANAPNAKVLNIEEEASAVLEVAQGKADVFIYDPLSIIRHNETYKDSTRVILDPLPNTKGWGIALNKGQEDLKAKLNEFIKTAKTDGTYDQIREKYLKEQKAEFDQYGLEFFF